MLKSRAETEFSRLQNLLFSSEFDCISGTAVVPDISEDFIIFTYFDVSLQNQIHTVQMLSLPDRTLPDYAGDVYHIVIQFQQICVHVSAIERRLRFGYDYLILLSLMLIAISVVIILVNSSEQKRELMRYRIEQDEQFTISRELHDGVVQSLAAAKIQLEAHNSNSALICIEEATSEVRWLCGMLRFDLTEPFNTVIKKSSSAFTQTYAIPVTVLDSSVYAQSMPQRDKLELLRIVQEAFSNIARHARATQVFIKLIDSGDLFIMSIADNGRGFFCQQQNKIDTFTENFHGHHIGMESIKERAELLGGHASWKNENGVTVVVTIPIK